MTRRHFIPTAALLLGLLLTTGAAWGFVSRFEVIPGGTTPALHWNFDAIDPSVDPPPDQNPVTRAIRFHLGTTISKSGIQSNEWNSARAAFAQWQAVPGTKIRFEESTSVTGPAAIDPTDGANVVAWLPAGTYAGFPLNSLTIAVTLLSVLDDGTIVEADIAVNRDLNYLADFSAQSAERPYLEGVVLHEIGHVLGANHSPIGGATMFWYTGGGVGTTAGLSADEIAFAQTAYALPATRATLGTVRGSVTLNGAPVLGAMVVAERTNGIVLQGTLTHAGGGYELSALPPGDYRLRVTPLDPNGGNDAFLVRGADLDVSTTHEYQNAATGFLPLTNGTATVTAGGVVTRNFAVTAGTPPFRITEMRIGLARDGRGSGDVAVQLAPGTSNSWVGVYVPGLKTADVTLRLTGDGLTYGAPEVLFPPNALRQLTLVQVPVTVASNATPGLRSLTLTAAGYTTWANGFAEVTPTAPDFNFDGLDDRFQRRYFAPFTRAEAGPEQDPDNDGFVNRREAAMGSDPTDAKSVLYRITRVRLTASGTTVTWESAPGKKYQVWSRPDLAAGSWQPVGNPVTAAGETAQFIDPRPAVSLRLYQVRNAP